MSNTFTLKHIKPSYLRSVITGIKEKMCCKGTSGMEAIMQRWYLFVYKNLNTQRRRNSALFSSYLRVVS